MRVNDYEHLFKIMLEENLKDSERYIILLKVIGNNSKYDFNSQVSIAYHNKDATACAEYDFWQKTFNRVVKRGQKGIPTLRQFGEYKKVVYVFDVSQTVSKDRNANEINLWRMNEKERENTLNALLHKADLSANEFDTTILKLKAAVRHIVSENYSVIANELKVELFKQNEFKNFLEESLLVSVSERLGINYVPNIELLEDNLKGFDKISFQNLGFFLSTINKNLITSVMEMEKEVFRLKQQTKEDDKRYNIDKEVDTENNQTKGGILNDKFRSSNRDELNEARGESVSYFSKHRGDFREDRRTYDERTMQSSTNEPFRQRETALSNELRERETSGITTTDVWREESNESSSANRGTSNTVYGESQTYDDERMGDNRNAESHRSVEMGGSYEQLEFFTERNDLKGDSLQLEEVEKATSFFYSKEESNDLEIQQTLDDYLEKVEDFKEKYGIEDFDSAVRIKEGLDNLKRIYEEKNQAIKKLFYSPLISSLNVKVDEKDFNNLDLKQIFKDFHWSDRRSFEEFNPFNEDDTSNLITLNFFKNNDGEYRVMYNNSDSLLYHSNLKEFMKELDSKLKDEVYQNIAIKVGAEFILVDTKDYSMMDIEIKDTNTKVLVDGISYPLYSGSTFDESAKVDKLIDSGKFTVYKINEHLKDDFDKNIALINDVTESFESIDVSKEKYNKNFIITNEVQAEKLTPSERINNNLEAISMLKRLEKGERELDLIAQEVLAKYVGWGGLADVFDEDKRGQWEVARNFLKDNLTSKEYENAKESTLTAFYTPKVIIDSIYQGLERLGFKQGNILEPSLGIGNFIGNLPDTMSQSKIYGSELDSISGKIAQYLYPKSNIKVQGFEESKFSNNFFDIAVGNVPFGEFKVNDREYDKNNFLIHDYFFAKSIDKVRTGGIIAFITSSGTMDKKDDSIRRYLGSRCDLLGAIRLPNTTFKGVAGTEVTSNILFLQKKSSVLNKEQDWYNLDYDDNGNRYNKYFVDHPEMVLGNIKEVSGRFGNVLTCEEKENVNLKDLLSEAILNLEGKYEEVDI